MEQAKQELSRKDSELLALRTKLETLNNQFSDSKQHVDVLKESLTAKEQRAAILQTEVNLLFLTYRRLFVFDLCFISTSWIFFLLRWMLCVSVWKKRSLSSQKRVSRSRSWRRRKALSKERSLISKTCWMLRSAKLMCYRKRWGASSCASNKPFKLISGENF